MGYALITRFVHNHMHLHQRCVVWETGGAAGPAGTSAGRPRARRSCRCAASHRGALPTAAAAAASVPALQATVIERRAAGAVGYQDGGSPYGLAGVHGPQPAAPFPQRCA
jgi:hypothetical protein